MRLRVVLIVVASWLACVSSIGWAQPVGNLGWPVPPRPVVARRVSEGNPPPPFVHASGFLPDNAPVVARRANERNPAPPLAHASGFRGPIVGQGYSGAGLPSATNQRASPRLDALADCDDDPMQGVIGLLGYDSWRNVADDSWQNNGVSVGLNYGTRLGRFSDLTGIGFQIGGTVGVFDWLGTDYRLTDRNTAETQGFFTYGFFRKPDEQLPFSAAVVEDWMFNDNFGVYAQNPTLSQIRWQAGYAVNAWNEFGLWGAQHVKGDTRIVGGVGATSWRAVNQLNPYWHHKWTEGGADTVIWIGLPERHRLAGNGSLGDYIAGALATVPMNDRVSLSSLITYMHASSRPGPIGSTEDSWNFTIALLFYPGRNARASTVAGRCWLPQLPIANNGLFMVDTNRH